MSKQELIDRLNEFKAFKDNWNGYGAKPFNENDIEVVIKFISKLKDNLIDGLYIFPLPNGGVQLEYDYGYNEGNEFLEIEVMLDEPKFECLYGIYDNEEETIFRNEKEFTIKNDMSAVKRCLTKFKNGGFKKHD